MSTYCTVLYCTVLYCTAVLLYCAVLCCAVLCCTVLYCTVLCCTVLYCTVLPRTGRCYLPRRSSLTCHDELTSLHRPTTVLSEHTTHSSGSVHTTNTVCTLALHECTTTFCTGAFSTVTFGTVTFGTVTFGTVRWKLGSSLLCFVLTHAHTQ